MTERSTPGTSPTVDGAHPGFGSTPVAPGIPNLHFRSITMPADERFERWRATVGKVYDLAAPGHHEVGALEMDASVWHFGSLIVGDNKFGSRLQQRSPRNIRADPVDHYRLLLQTRGTLNIDAGLRREVLGPGRLLLTDLARPETYATEGGSNVAVFIPRDILDEALPRPLDLHGVALSGPCAMLLGEHLCALLKNTASFNRHEIPALNQATVSLLAASLATSAQSLDHARPAMEASILRQACRYIDFHLTEPKLSAIEICKFFRMSRATLYRLFEAYGGVSSYIKERRLVRVNEILASSTQRQHLGRLADDYGFKTATHFSRAFREQFGYSPSEVRQVNTYGSNLPVKSANYGSFSQWMGSLRG